MKKLFIIFLSLITISCNNNSSDEALPPVSLLIGTLHKEKVQLFSLNSEGKRQNKDVISLKDINGTLLPGKYSKFTASGNVQKEGPESYLVMACDKNYNRTDSGWCRLFRYNTEKKDPELVRDFGNTSINFWKYLPEKEKTIYYHPDSSGFFSLRDDSSEKIADIDLEGGNRSFHQEGDSLTAHAITENGTNKITFYDTVESTHLVNISNFSSANRDFVVSVTPSVGSTAKISLYKKDQLIAEKELMLNNYLSHWTGDQGILFHKKNKLIKLDTNLNKIAETEIANPLIYEVAEGHLIASSQDLEKQARFPDFYLIDEDLDRKIPFKKKIRRKVVLAKILPESD